MVKFPSQPSVFFTDSHNSVQYKCHLSIKQRRLFKQMSWYINPNITLHYDIRLSTEKHYLKLQKNNIKWQMKVFRRGMHDLVINVVNIAIKSGILMSNILKCNLDRFFNGTLISVSSRWFVSFIIIDIIENSRLKKKS